MRNDEFTKKLFLCRLTKYDWDDEIPDIEDAIQHSGDGLEERLIAKDILYKFNAYLIEKRGRGFQLKERLAPYYAKHLTGERVKETHGYQRKSKHDIPITWSVRKHFKRFIEDHEL